MKNLPKWVAILFVIVSLICIGLVGALFFLSRQQGGGARFSIKVTSKIPQISVSLKNKERLLGLLQQREFFEKGAIVYGENFQWVKPERLLIILTSQLQEQGRFFEGENNEPSRSFGVQYKDGEYRLLLHWSPSAYAESGGEELDQQLTYDFGRAILRVTKNPDIASVEFLSEEENMLLEDFSQEAVFSIGKKQKQSWLKELEKLFIPEVLAVCGGAAYDCAEWRSWLCCPAGSIYNDECKNINSFCGPWNNRRKCTTCSKCGPLTTITEPCGGLNQSRCANPCTGGNCLMNNYCYWYVPTPTPTAPPPPTPTPAPTPVPSCTVDLLPNTLTVDVGSALTLTASVTIGSGTIDQVNFSSANTSVATVNPASDSTPVYSTQATGVSTGSTTVTSDVVMGGVARCTDTSTVNVTPPGPWWQVRDADVTTNGDIISPIPGTCVLPVCNPVLGLRGTGGFPGVPAYGGNFDALSGSGSGKAAEAPYNWSANSSFLGTRVYNYNYFRKQIPDDVIFNELTPPVTGGTFNSGGAPSRGYVWYHWNGATLGDLTIQGNVNLVGARRVVLMVEKADLYINGRIQLQNPGQGFFMAVVGKDANGLKGDIRVDPSVDDIEGVYLAEGEFRTGISSSQLSVRGSVAAYDGVVLERDLGASNSTTPAEYFEYAPEIIATFPRVFTHRRMRWKEVAP